jgi:hypothetical protein
VANVKSRIISTAANFCILREYHQNNQHGILRKPGLTFGTGRYVTADPAHPENEEWHESASLTAQPGESCILLEYQRAKSLLSEEHAVERQGSLGL